MRTYYSVKGTTGDVQECAICGRDDLTKTVILHQFEYGSNEYLETIYAGTDCAAKVVGCPQHEMKQRARNADKVNRYGRL